MAFLDFKRENLSSDLTAGLTTALVTIPDGMASAVLAGVNPVQGLYALMVGTPVAALTTSAQLMYVANTGALAVATGSALAGLTGEERFQSLIVLTVLVGVFQLALGLLRMGSLLRFVSNAVLTGFMTGIAVLIILGQLPEITGYHSDYSNKVLQAFDLALHANQVIITSLITGLVAIVVIVLLERTRLAKFNMVLGMLAASLLVYLAGWSGVTLIGDITDIPRQLPSPTLPDLSLVPGLLFPALAVAIIGLVQAAGVSKSVPNPDGEYSNVSRDFAGQGLANLASGLFKGMPIGGTMSETAVNVNSGAVSRWAGIFSGLFITGLVLLLAGVVELIPMPAIAGLLLVAGYEAIDREEVMDVWDIGWGPRLIMLITFAATMVLPVQYAVLAGVLLSILHYVYASSLDIYLVEVALDQDGMFEERTPPRQLPSRQATILHLYGTAFFASMETLEQMLPSPQSAEHAIVILNVRGRRSIGSSFVRIVERYDAKLHDTGGKLMLCGVDENVLKQIEVTETTEDIPREDIFLATNKLGESTRRALSAAEEWLAALEEETS